jgi:hypothetical protein
MQDFTKSLHIAPPLPILKLVKDLTIGQRSVENRDQLSSFLRAHIFPKLGPFFVEIYYPDSQSDSFLPSQFLDQAANRQKHVPENLPADLNQKS